MGLSRLRSSAEQKAIFYCAFGWPMWLVAPVAVVEVAVAFTMLASPSIGLPLLVCLAGGAMYLHAVRQEAALVGLPAAILAVTAMAAHSLNVDYLDVNEMVSTFGTALVVGGAGAAAVSATLGHKARPRALHQMHAAVMEAAAETKHGKDARRYERESLPKGSKSL